MFILINVAKFYWDCLLNMEKMAVYNLNDNVYNVC